MWICKECFVDEEIRKEVENNSTEVRVCDICDKMGKACDLSCFDDFFISVIHLFKADEESPYTLVDILDKDWGIFSNPSYARTILNAVICVNRLAVNLDDKVSYIDDIMERVSVWEQLKTDVKENFRYFVDHDKFDEYADLSPSSTLKEGSLLFRARVTPEGQKRLTPNNMGCPDKSKATASRANPLGIPYLYLCKDEETTYYEVRAVFLDKLCVGKFRIQRDLRIVDFNSKSRAMSIILCKWKRDSVISSLTSGFCFQK